MAVAQVFVRKSELFASKEEGYLPGVSAGFGHAGLQPVGGLKRDPVLAGCGTHDKGAIVQCLGDGVENMRGPENFGPADSRHGLAEGHAIGRNQAEVGEPEVRDGARRRSDIQRISRSDKYDGGSGNGFLRDEFIVPQA